MIGFLSSLSILLFETLVVLQRRPPQSFSAWHQNPYLLAALAALVAGSFLLGLTGKTSERVIYRFALGLGVMLCFIALFKMSVVPSECLISIPFTRTTVRCRYLTAFLSVIAALSAHYLHGSAVPTGGSR